MAVKVLDFYADWCGPCKTQEPILEDVAEEWEDDDDVSVEKIDVDNDSETATSYQVRSIPTIVVVVEDEDGTDEFTRFVGVTEEDDINEAVTDALNA